MRWWRGLPVLGLMFVVTPAFAQATARPCGTEESVGPACLMAHQDLPTLPTGPVYWHLDTFPSKEAAGKAAVAGSTVVEAFDKVWLFTIAREGWRPKGGTHVSDIGPLPVERAPMLSAEYLRSVFTPGMTAPLHIHSGPEAFFAVSGDTCLETPEGVKTGRGPNNSLFIRGGPPMLLMAIGSEPRKGFALILHDMHKPPTTLTQQWQPKGLCAAEIGKR